MTEKKLSGAIRKYVTGILAAGALLAIYSVSTVAVTGVGMAVTDTTAQARGGRGRGRGFVRGRGRGRGRGFFRGGLWVPQIWCHQSWNSRRVYCEY